MQLNNLIKQQYATRALFFIPGLMFATWALMIPFVKSNLGVDDDILGLIILCLGVGSVISMPTVGILARIHGCKKLIIITILLQIIVLPLLIYVDSVFLLAGFLILFGIGLGGLDCAMNLQAVIVEKESKKSMMSNFHSFYSIGVFLGSVIVASLLRAKNSPLLICFFIAILVFILFLLATPHCRSDISSDKRKSAFIFPNKFVIFLGILCFIAFLVEGVIADWGAIFLEEIRGMEKSNSGWGLAIFSFFMTIMRFFGDVFIQRLGRVLTVIYGGSLAFVGFLMVCFINFWIINLIGFALVAVGASNIVPIIMSLTGQQKTMPSDLALPSVITFGYIGVLLGPAVIGFISKKTGLTFAFLGVAFLLLIIIFSISWVCKKAQNN